MRLFFVYPHSADRGVLKGFRFNAGHAASSSAHAKPLKECWGVWLEAGGRPSRAPHKARSWPPLVMDRQQRFAGEPVGTGLLLGRMHAGRHQGGVSGCIGHEQAMPAQVRLISPTKEWRDGLLSGAWHAALRPLRVADATRRTATARLRRASRLAHSVLILIYRP